MGTSVHDDQVSPVLPLTTFGSIGWYKEFLSHHSVFIEIKEHFPKQSFRNRYEILTSNGVLPLSIPIKKPLGTNTPYDQIVIDSQNWKDIHWRSVTSAYASSPYFDYYEYNIRNLIYEPEELLYRFNLRILDQLISWLELPVSYQLTSEFSSYKINDLRLNLAAKHAYNQAETAPYIQCFPGKNTFNQRLSILDGLFCEGPLIRNLILK